MYHVDSSPYPTKSAYVTVVNLGISILLGCVHYILIAFTDIPLSLFERWILSIGLMLIAIVSTTILYGQRRAWSFRRLIILGLLNGILWVLVLPTGSTIIRLFT